MVNEPATIRQSLLRTFSRCPQSAKLYLAHGDESTSHAAHRGSAFHTFAEQATQLLIERGEHQLPPEIAKDLLADVMADPAYVIPAKEADELRAMVYRFAEDFMLEPAKVIAVEQAYRLEVDGMTLTGRIDLAEAGDGVAILTDYKTSAHVPPLDEYGVTQDGVVRNARNAQLLIYCLLFAQGVDDNGVKLPKFDSYRLRQVFPRYRLEEGGLVSREVTVQAGELYDHRLWLDGLVKKLRHSFDTDEWPAVPGSQCGECSAPALCPLSAAVRASNGSGEETPTEIPETLGEAQKLAREWKFRSLALRREKANLKAFAKQHDCDLPYAEDSDQGLLWKVRNERKLDVDGLIAAAIRAAEIGEPLNVESFYSVKTSTRFEEGKLNG